jgi:hypothetical protein
MKLGRPTPLEMMMTKNPFSTEEKLITLAYAVYLFSYYGSASVIQTISREGWSGLPGNPYHQKYWAIVGPKLSRPPRDLDN